MPIFLIFSLIYYIPLFLVGIVAKKQNKSRELFRERNSKISWVQSFLMSLIYFVLVGEIGLNICTTYDNFRHGLGEGDGVMFIFTMFIPNLIQYLNSLVFFPKYWNPQIKGIYRKVLLLFFFLSNIYFTIKITSIILTTNTSSSLSGLFFIFSALPAIPAFFIICNVVAKISKPDLDSTSETKGFFSWKFSRPLIHLALLLGVLIASQKALTYKRRVELGISPSEALNISKEELLTNEVYILGEDKNSNKIRDDYEAWVKREYIDHDKKMAMLQYGHSQYMHMQTTLKAVKKINGKKELQFYNLEEQDQILTEYYVRMHLFWSGACLDYTFGNIDNGYNVRKKADSVLLNNKDRFDLDRLASFSGGGFNIPDYEGCLFIFKKNASSQLIISKNLRNELLMSIENGDAERIKVLSEQLSLKSLNDYMAAQISTAALVKDDENILNILFDNGLDFRKKFRDGIYGSSEDPYSVAQGLGASNSLKWFKSKYK